MPTILPLGPYTASGSGAAVDLGVYRGGVFVLSTLDLTAGASITIETSPDALTWRVAGFILATDVSTKTRTLGSLDEYVRASYALGAETFTGSVDVAPVQIYATRAEFDSLGLQTGSLQGVEDETIMAALQAASRLVDDYIGARATLPLVVFASASVARAVSIVATYDLLSVIGYNPDGPDQNFRDRYLDILKWLRDIATGLIPLPPGVIDSTPNAIEGSPEVFSDCPRGW